MVTFLLLVLFLALLSLAAAVGRVPDTRDPRYGLGELVSRWRPHA